MFLLYPKVKVEDFIYLFFIHDLTSEKLSKTCHAQLANVMLTNTGSTWPVAAQSGGQVSVLTQ